MDWQEDWWTDTGDVIPVCQPAYAGGTKGCSM